MLRGALMYFNVDQRLKSVVITSPGQEDGKTTVAVRLAQSAARAGRNVILVDADLRRPQIGPRLHLDAPTGLGTVLAGEADLWSVLVEVPVTAEGDSQITAQGACACSPPALAAPNPSGAAELRARWSTCSTRARERRRISSSSTPPPRWR